MSGHSEEALGRIHSALRENYNFGVTRFCFRGVWDAQPETVEGRLQRDEILREIAPETDFGGYHCNVDGCNVQNYPTQPDNPKAVEQDGETFTPPSGPCALGRICLKTEWELYDQSTSDLVKAAMSEATVQECGRVAGGIFMGGLRCPSPGCDYSAGFSEDGVKGTAGECDKEKEVS